MFIEAQKYNYCLKNKTKQNFKIQNRTKVIAFFRPLWDMLYTLLYLQRCANMRGGVPGQKYIQVM